MADVFVSYAREDEARVAALVQALQRHGRSVFWDRQIPAGRTWREHIGTQLAQARCVVVAWSTHSVGSDFVAEEADDARQRGALVPVLIDPVLPPLGFRSVQAAELTTLRSDLPHVDFEPLLHAVDAVLASQVAAPAAPGGVTPSKPSPAAPVPDARLQPTARRGLRLWWLAAGLACAALVAWVSLRKPDAAPTATATADGTRVEARPESGVQLRITDAWRSEDGSLTLRVRLQHAGPKALTVEPARAFSLLGAGRDGARPPAQSSPLFETVAPGQSADFELRFDAAQGARALQLTLPGSTPQQWPLPALQ